LAEFVSELASVRTLEALYVASIYSRKDSVSFVSAARRIHNRRGLCERMVRAFAKRTYNPDYEIRRSYIRGPPAEPKRSFGFLLTGKTPSEAS